MINTAKEKSMVLSWQTKGKLDIMKEVRGGFSGEETIEMKYEKLVKVNALQFHPCCCKGYKLLSLCCVEFHCVNVP